MPVNPTLIVWSDLDPQLVTDTQGDIKKGINVGAVKSSIDNILRTSPGERVMLPTFALGMRNLLFDPINQRLLNRLSDSVKQAIEIWDDRVFIEEVSFKVNADYSTVSVDLTFRIRSYYEVFNHVVIVNP